MELGLKGRRAFIGGSSKGLGLAIAQGLAREGADVTICSRSRAALESARQSLQAESSGRISMQVCDLSSADQVQQLAAALASEGGIDILVNNVGGPSPSRAEATTAEAWRSGFEQIFMGAASLTQALLPHMKQKCFGRIITITSLSVVEPIDFLAVSSSMRAAVTGFMKTLSTEVAGHGVTVNLVMPGIIHTDRIENLRRAKADRDQTSLEVEMEKTKKSIPMQRLGRPEELAALVTFLASDRAGYITGANIPVDGGLRKSW